MINSFKNFERIRYRISNDINKLGIQNKDSNDSMEKELSSTVFASVFSAFLTEVALNDKMETINWCDILSCLLIFVIIYIVAFWVYKLITRKIKFFLGKRKHHKIDNSMENMIQIQKDFDNIACDSILVARDYRSAFENLKKLEEEGTAEKDNNLKAFYLFEVMHYMETACKKTKALVKHKDKCIRTLDEGEGADIFRVKNIINIMHEIDEFLNNNLRELEGYADQQKAIDYQLGEIGNLIGDIEKILDL